MAALCAHRTDAVLQQRACDALAIFAFSDEANKVKAAAAGAFQAVVAGLRAHEANACVQQFGCRALAHVGRGNHNRKLAAGIAGAIPAVLAALRRHADVEDVQCAACDALACLTCDVHEHSITAGAAGAVELVTRALPHAVELVRQQVCLALGNLTYSSNENRLRASRAGATEALLALLRGANGSDEHRAACYALFQIVSTPVAAVRAGEHHGAVGTILAVLRAHLGDLKIQGFGCGTLVHLLGTSPARVTEAWRANAGQLMRSALLAHDDAVLECECNKVLRLLQQSAAAAEAELLAGEEAEKAARLRRASAPSAASPWAAPRACSTTDAAACKTAKS